MRDLCRTMAHPETASRTKTGCRFCKLKHLKCDQRFPCGRCETSGIECVRAYTYRSQLYTFAADQMWLAIPDSFTFVDETDEVVSSYDGDSEAIIPQLEDRETDQSVLSDAASPTESQGRPADRSLGRASLALSTSSSQTKSPTERVNFSQSSAPRSVNGSMPLYHHPLSIDELIDQNGTQPFHQHGHQMYSHGHTASTVPQIYSRAPIWPLTDPSEALLLRHFVQNLAIWLDLCDPLQHFQTDVPHRAGTCRILLNAIFALSARHLNRIGHYDSYASNRYHQECLKVLIPMLNDTATVLDESLFAATIILRVLEEIDMPETNSQGHLLGIQVFVSARDPYASGGGLGEAAFWVGLRQEIYSAMMKHKSIKLNLEHCIVDRSIEPAPDFTWANRAVVHCADVLNCCFGELGVSNVDWRGLKEYNQRWNAAKPPPFTPVYYRSPDRVKREAFPEIWYFQPCHIIGIQHHLLAQIILAIFDPKLPRVGGSRSTAVKAMEYEVKSSLRELCGIGLYNRWTPPGIFTASMGIALCGDRFTDRIDQEALLDVLVKTEKDHARPTASIQLQMKESWGWTSDDLS